MNKAQSEALVRESLLLFIKKHLPRADLSLIDDIVMTYVVTFLDTVTCDPQFDLEDFIEMMSVYVPEFLKLEPTIIYTWMLSLESKLMQANKMLQKKGKEDPICLTLRRIAEGYPVSKNKYRSFSSDSESGGEEKNAHEKRRTEMEKAEFIVQCKILREMFPDICGMEIKHCVGIATGDIERAAGTLIHRQENGLSMESPNFVSTRTVPIDDKELKNRIVARYSYIEKNENRDYRPAPPKYESKKMVRYRDSKIVSVKGERFTEVPKAISTKKVSTKIRRNKKRTPKPE